jgi:hypothetical protein
VGILHKYYLTATFPRAYKRTTHFWRCPLRRPVQGSLLLMAVLVFLPVCRAQTAPQHVRDYIYGPNGRLILTTESDVYPPTIPNGIVTTVTGSCPSFQVVVSWGSSTDIGTGVASYNVYRDGNNKGTSTTLSYTDSTVRQGGAYLYTVSAVDRVGNEGNQTSSSEADIPTCEELLLFDSAGKTRRILAARIGFLGHPLRQSPPFPQFNHSFNLVPARVHFTPADLSPQWLWPFTFYSPRFAAFSLKPLKVSLVPSNHVRTYFSPSSSDSVGGGQ